MRLIERRLRSRTFLIQFSQIMNEFGQEIPWLEPLKDAAHATNATWFRDRLLHELKCEDESSVTPFQFVTSDDSRAYVGGMIHFRRSPECFKSRENQEIADRLTSEGYQYISCLQVRDSYRSVGHGRELMYRVINAIRRRYGRVWGVVSSPHILQWHLSLQIGTQVHSSPSTNHEQLGIISFS